MIKFAHFIETGGIGGVQRNLATLQQHMTGVEHAAHWVSPRSQLPPVVPADQLIVIHFTASWSKMPYLAALRAMRGRAPIVIVEHSYTKAYEGHRVPSLARFRAMLTLIYGSADRVIAVSHGQGEWLRSIGVVDPAKVVVIPSSTYCGVFQDIAPPSRQGACDAPLRIGAFGRYNEEKGFRELIHAMKLLPPGLATLTMAGVGPLHDELVALADGMPNITVGGPTTDVPAFLREVDVVAVPSLWESFGQTALEARAAARPIITSRVDGLIEQTGADCGWQVQPGDIAGLARAITTAAHADLTTMGKAARRSTEGHLEASYDAWRRLAVELMPSAAAGSTVAAKAA